MQLHVICLDFPLGVLKVFVRSDNRGFRFRAFLRSHDEFHRSRNDVVCSSLRLQAYQLSLLPCPSRDAMSPPLWSGYLNRVAISRPVSQITIYFAAVRGD